jgi:uncharacterized integral membrane protein
MVVLGFIVLALAVAAVCVLIGQNTDQVEVHALGGTWTVEMYWLVVAGVVLTAAAMIGILLIVVGGSRARKHRNRRRDLERENRRLASQVGTAPSDTSSAPRSVDGDTRHYAEPAPSSAPPDGFTPAPGYPAAPPADSTAPPRQ